MAPSPARRSSRLQRLPATPRTLQGLGTLTERDDTPERKQSISTLISKSQGKSIPGSFDITTPEQQPTHPSDRNMHPEYAHRSTIKVSNAGLRFGFADIRRPDQSSPIRPSSSRTETSPAPSIVVARTPHQQFNFNRDDTELGEEGRKIMASVRDQTERIKEKMRQERQEQKRRDEEAEEEAGLAGRRFAKPKSRYSDVHKAEFNKMPSIADQASWRKNGAPHPQRPAPVELQPTMPKELKRTHSKVDLQASKLPTLNHISPAYPKPITPSLLKRSTSKVDLQASKGKTGLPSLKRTQSKVDLQSGSKDVAKSAPREDVRTDTSPVKRRKMNVTEDVSAARPASSGTPSSKIPTSSKGGLPSAVTTPTKSSLSRSRSVKDLTSSKLPALSNPTHGLVRSKSVRDIAKPSGFRTASGKLAAAVSKSVNSVRSILHKPAPKYSDDPMKIAAGTHRPFSQATPSIQEGTPSLPGTPRPNHTIPRATPKRVEFAPDTKDASNNIISPSPAHTLPVQYPDLARSIERSFSVSPSKTIVSDTDDVPTPKAGYPTPARQAFAGRSSLQSSVNPLFSNPPDAGDFTFRSDMRISFGTGHASGVKSSTHGASPISRSASIRHVRPTGTSTSIVVTPSRMNNDAAPHRLLGVAHGINNKKRAREGDDSDMENVDPRRRAAEQDDEESREQGSPRKRTKISTPEGKKAPVQSSAKTRRQTGIGAKPHKKGGLSMARLNFLSTPKSRR